MLRFTKISINNFGPYQETQTIDFPKDDGVIIVWGENGFGKTTLMNCIRYALWGKVSAEKEEKDPIASYVNCEAVSRGEDMVIELHMTYDNNDYILTRKLGRRPGTSGNSDDDYNKEVYLQKGGSVVSPEECTHFLNTAIPQDISRFYLFDGELLQQYENLLKVGADNTLIKDSIEDILGLPVLEDSRDSLEVVMGEYYTAFTNASALDARTQQDTAKLVALKEKEKELIKNKGELEDLLQDAVDDLAVVDKQLENTETYRTLSNEIKTCTNNITEWQNELNDEKEVVKDSLDNLWEAHLKKVVEEKIREKETLRDELFGKIEKQNTDNAILSILKKILEEHGEGCACPICNSDILEQNIKFIKTQIAVYSGAADSRAQEDYNNIRADISQLKSLSCEDKTAQIKAGLKSINTLRTKIQLEEIKRGRAEKERRNLGETEDDATIEGLMPEHDRIISRISNFKNGIKTADDQIADNKVSMEKLRKKIEKNQSNAEVGIVQKQYEICNKIFEIFDEAIEAFKHKLKDNVQQDATDYFVSISHNPDYTNLKINDQYGLEILTSDGTVVQHRSAGYVQVVALSLIAALHKNAPISGPIIMDSTFQRIDPKHKRRILESLPVLGQQVIVLAYPEEIQTDVARGVLKGKLRKEINLEQVSSFKTLIK